MLKAFQAGEIGPGRLSKVAGAVLPAFQKRIVYRIHVEGLKIGEIGSGRLLKAHGAAPRNPLSHRRKVKLAGFQKLWANYKAFGAIRLISIKYYSDT